MNRKSVQPRHVCLLLLILPAYCAGICMKQSEITQLVRAGYQTKYIHTNTCFEIASSVIKGTIAVGSSKQLEFYRTYTEECCCSVTNYSQQQVTLEGENGANDFLVARYRRIESCGCRPCHQVKRDTFRRSTTGQPQSSITFTSGGGAGGEK